MDVLMTMVSDAPSLVELSERELRRQIDHSVLKAMLDSEFARNLLADPTLALDQRGCSPQQYRELRSINASNLTDFAQQAVARFWFDPRPFEQEDQQFPLVAAAAI
jgi:hypothetical protein